MSALRAGSGRAYRRASTAFEPSIGQQTSLLLGLDLAIGQIPPSVAPQPGQEITQIPIQEADDSQLHPLPDMDQFVGQQQARAGGRNGLGQEQEPSKGHADVGARQRRHSHEPHPAGQFGGNQVVRLDLFIGEPSQPTTRCDDHSHNEPGYRDPSGRAVGAARSRFQAVSVDK